MDVIEIENNRGAAGKREAGDSKGASVSGKKSALTACWNCFLGLLFIAFVIIIILHSLLRNEL